MKKDIKMIQIPEHEYNAMVAELTGLRELINLVASKALSLVSTGKGKGRETSPKVLEIRRKRTKKEYEEYFKNKIK